MEITSVEKKGNNQNKFLVYIEGEYGFTISESDYLRLNLYEKKNITEDEIKYINNVINFSSAKKSAIKYLSRKYRSEKEVESKMNRDGFPKETVESVINELKSMGYINDRIYAQKYIFDRSKLKPKSRKMLKYELKNKGIKQHIIDEVLNESGIDNYAVAKGLVKKKFGKYDLTDEKIIKKACAFLKHRGFEYEIIVDVIKKFNE